MALEASGNEELRPASEALGLHLQPWSCLWTEVSEDPAESPTQLWSRGTLQFESREKQTDTVGDLCDYSHSLLNVHMHRRGS